MSYNGTIFLPTQSVVIVSTDADLQALSSKSSVVGGGYFSEESGLYYFSNNILNPSTNDLLANDNGGIYKFANPQSFVFLDSNNKITNLNLDILPSEISLNNGQILQGNSSNQAEAVTMSGDMTLATGGIATLGSGVAFTNRVVLAGTWTGTPISGPPAIININVPGATVGTDYPVCGIQTSPFSLSSDVPFLFQAAIYSQGVVTLYLSTDVSVGPLSGWYMIFRPINS